MWREASANEISYLRKASTMLHLSTSAWATGTVLFHRYCAFVNTNKDPHSDLLPTHISIMLCLYLATKVTEEPRKQRDIINVGYKLAHPDSTFLPISSSTLSALRVTLTQGELILMRALGFNVTVDLPHAWIASTLYGMMWWERNGQPPDDTEMVDVRAKRVAGTAWVVANAVVERGLVDREPARLIAAACIYIAMDNHGEKLPAKSLDEWADIWAKSTGRRIEAVRALIEQSIDVPLIIEQFNIQHDQKPHSLTEK
ncbi:hypothetical protein LPJ66_011261 [Kickxella alabastrina]|uniref:Uncharacterized protein n=1 Tax=Kickxella alabastrina TaxID=61397 RepID=A0ACC1HY93_9FUNG|nr:hypothetical protein LPJ66_011261 [Kickxella alabastrina]